MSQTENAEPATPNTIGAAGSLHFEVQFHTFVFYARVCYSFEKEEKTFSISLFSACIRVKKPKGGMTHG